MFADFVASLKSQVDLHIVHVDCDPDEVHAAIVDELTHAPSLYDADFVCITTRPKKQRGSISDSIIRYYEGNVLVVKAVADPNDPHLDPPPPGAQRR